MSKFYGMIGYVKTEEVRPGVFKPVATERPYVGDVIESSRRWQASESVNGNIVFSDRFSVICDKFASENLGFMKYVKYMGTAWKVKSVSFQHPRIIISVEDVYDGPQAAAT